MGYGGRSGRRCWTGKKVPQTELQGDPWIDLTPILCPFEERIQTHLPASSSLAGIFVTLSHPISFPFLVRLLLFCHLLRCRRAVPRGLYILPLILYAYRHHGLHDWGRDLFEPFEEIQVRFLCAGVLYWFKLVANRMIGWCFWENRVVCILDSFDTSFGQWLLTWSRSWKDISDYKIHV